MRGCHASCRLLATLSLGVSLLLGLAPVRADEDAGPLSAEVQSAIRLLEARDLYDRQTGFMQLELLRDPAAVPVVRGYLDHKSADMRSFAIRALAAIEGATAVPELVGRLKTERSPTVRIAIILALEPLQDPAILPALIPRLRDRSPEVRMAALDVVSRFDAPDAREAILIRQRRERHRDVQRVLKDALQRLNAS